MYLEINENSVCVYSTLFPQNHPIICLHVISLSYRQQRKLHNTQVNICVTLHHLYNNINSELDATITVY